MFGLGKPRSNFGKWIDRKGLKQQWISNKSGVSHGTISQLAINDDRVPTYRNAQKIIKALREVDPSVKADQFWDL
ncbi:helix-turn-helix domain-containing protein [Chengkuizengella axinellae]|uniref:Helix-turn-helix transcriptional regulator n=1 Tax=Chengkuizengella axinellae TaxID=3064388 RepID=A0ABT9J105_9BACL|nr:helix-turn-helix transcriptional regulator [Chengkuizengella sp. 2205SS18-9]MDP5275255.1 helix-turn-helix transcriptional regulator [Chengkuizengella sp. 2205SS18-9]